jgi:MbtH protein
VSAVRDEAGQDYKVVVNGEEQYSLWPAGWDNAPGWRDAGVSGARDKCLAWLQDVWTDLRPATLRAPQGSASAASAR